MSIPVPPERLRAAIAERPAAAYVLTVSVDGHPHAVHAAIAWDRDALAASVGHGTASNAVQRPDAVAIVFPLRSPDDYSLIVDGTAAVDTSGARPLLRIAPTKAVLHRPAAVPSAPASACADDCVPLLSSGQPRPR